MQRELELNVLTKSIDGRQVGKLRITQILQSHKKSRGSNTSDKIQVSFKYKSVTNTRDSHAFRCNRITVRVVACKHACLGDGETGDGEASDKVPDEHLGRVRGNPVQDGEDVLEAQPALHALGLAFELLYGRVVEKRFPQTVADLFHDAAARGHDHLVHQRDLLRIL